MPKKYLSSGLVWLWVTLLIVVIDRYSKHWAMLHLSYMEPLRIFPILDFTLAYNKGAAFSFLHHAAGWQNVFFTNLALLVSVIVLYWLARLSIYERATSISLCLILSGAVGNAWDRLVYGFVVDFISFHIGSWHFAIFNIADSAICLGAIFLFWTWFGMEEE